MPCIDSRGKPCGGLPEPPFYGAAAIVHFEVGPRTCQVAQTNLREQVRIIDQDSALPQWSPTAKTIEISHGVGSDIQLFGYYPIIGCRREAPAPSSESPWRLLHQDLFFGDEHMPFLILHWKHTFNKIFLVDIIPVGTTHIQQIRR